MPQGMGGDDRMTGTRARSQASLSRALKALLLKGAPSRPGKTSADPEKSIPPARSRTPLTLSRKANHPSSESDNSGVRGRSRNDNPRNAVSPDIYAEDFSAAVDFLGTRPFVDRERIGIIGICGSGAFVISAAKIDPRLKAIATVSMYNHGDLYRKGLGNSLTPEQKKQFLAAAAEQRYVEFTGGETNC